MWERPKSSHSCFLRGLLYPLTLWVTILRESELLVLLVSVLVIVCELKLFEKFVVRLEIFKLSSKLGIIRFVKVLRGVL